MLPGIMTKQGENLADIDHTVEEGTIEEPERAITLPEPERIHPSSWWWLAGAIIIGLLIGLGSLDLIRSLARPIFLLIFGITIATALEPIVQFLESRIPRGIAIVLVYLVVVGLAVGIGFIVIPPLVSQAKLVGDRVPELADRARGYLQNLSFIDIGNITDTLTSELLGLSSTIVSLPIFIGSSLFDFIVILFISIYWLLQTPSMRRFVLSLFPEGQSVEVSEVLAKMGSSMGGYIRGSVITGFITGTMTYLGMLIIGIDYAVVLGLISGVFELIPVVGPILSGVVIVIFALLQAPQLAIFALLYIIAMQQIENHILVPNIMRSQTNISPLIVMLALLGGAALQGLLGALVAIPLVGAFSVLVTEVIAPKIRRWTGATRTEA
jgi:predicted PurR-regulated permease PerM